MVFKHFHVAVQPQKSQFEELVSDVSHVLNYFLAVYFHRHYKHYQTHGF